MYSILLICFAFGGDDAKPSFDCANLEKASDYLGQWRSAIAAESDRAQRTGNDIGLVELNKKLVRMVDGLKGKEVNWTMQVKGVVRGELRLRDDYVFKKSKIKVDAGPVTDIEPWMVDLRPGQRVQATGTIRLVMFYDEYTFILFSKVSVSRLP